SQPCFITKYKNIYICEVCVTTFSLGGNVLKLTIIGFWGGYPSVNGASSAYLLEKDGFRLMLDFGSGVLSKIQQYINVTDIYAILITHAISDHIDDIGVLEHV